MNAIRGKPLQPSAPRDFVVAGLYALRSTLVAGSVALIILAIREREIPWAKLGRVAADYRTLLAMVFLGLWIWGYWFQRAKRQRALVLRDLD